jgi:serine/threonine-protein kinase
MASENDILFARIALKKGFVEVDALTEALKDQARLRREGENVALDRVLLDRKAIEPKNRNRLRAAIRRHRKRIDIRGYEIYEQIGKGAMGTVYRARQISLDRVVALKLMPKITVEDAGDVKRFLREARLAASLNHPSIVKVFEVGEAQDRYFIAMEYVVGQNLDELVSPDEPFSQGRTLAVAALVARALVHAHSAGVIHRDLKPANIIDTGRGGIKMVDFGLAVAFGRPSEKITQAGIILGTPEYIPPEQARSPGDIDASADIYSFGAILYHLLSGRPPFEGKDVLEVLSRVFRREFMPLPKARPGLVPEVYDIVEATMAADPTRRPDAEEVGRTVEGILKKYPRLSKKRKKGSRDTHVLDLNALLDDPQPERSFAVQGWGAVAAAILLLSAVFFIVVLLTVSGGDGEEGEPMPVPTVTAPPDSHDNVPVSLKNDAEARKLLVEARRFMKKYPERRDEALERLRRIVERYPGTLGAYKARDEIEELNRKKD